MPLLLDSSDSIGWQDWFDRAGLDLTKSQQGLSIADSNSRVQAIIDGQGIAFWDRLVAYEINSGHLQYLSDIWLDEYGYYVRANDSSQESKAVQLFLNWLRDESKDATGLAPQGALGPTPKYIGLRAFNAFKQLNSHSECIGERSTRS